MCCCFVILTIPGHIYELFPVAVLIGTITALVQMAASSELTVFRSSGASLWQMIGALFKIALPLVILSFVCGELLAPPSERMAQQLRLKAQNAQVSLKEFRSGVWVKDEHSFVNVKNVMPDTSLSNIDIYQFDDTYHLQSITNAKRANFIEEGRWQLEDVLETRFSKEGTSTSVQPLQEWHSALNPSIFSVLLVVPEQMSAWSLYQYAEHLRENRQKSARYEIANVGQAGLPVCVTCNDAAGAAVCVLPSARRRGRCDDIHGHCAWPGVSLYRAVICQFGRAQRLAALHQCHGDDRNVFAAWDGDAVVDGKTLITVDRLLAQQKPRWLTAGLFLLVLL